MIKNVDPIEWIQGKLFSGQAQVAQKSWMIKNISKEWKTSGQLCFSGQAQWGCSKILNDKIISIQWKFQGNSVFQGKRKMFKIPECKSILNAVKNFWANSVFEGKRKLLKNPEWWKIHSIQWKISLQTLFFRVRWKNFQYYILQLVKAITAKFLVWENTTRKELHPLVLTSKVTTEFVYDSTSRRLHKERYCRIETHVEDAIGTEQNATL